MLATKVEVDLVDRGLLEALAAAPDAVAPDAVAPDAVAVEDDDELAPARGVALGAGLGLLSFGVVAVLGWWLL